jgi:hypothetical protein
MWVHPMRTPPKNRNGRRSAATRVEVGFCAMWGHKPIL